MRIAVWYNLPSGGAKRALHDHLVGLKERGHTIEIWRPPVLQAEYLDLSALAPEHEVGTLFEERDSSFYPLKIYYFAKRAERLVSSLKAISQECARQISEKGFDVLFANADMTIATPYIGRYFSGPKLAYLPEPVRMIHEAMPRLPWLLPEKHPSGNPIKKARFLLHDYIANRSVRVLATEEVDNAKYFDRILVNSFFSRESFMRSYGIDPKVCYLGIDASLFQYLRLPRERFVMSVGSLTPSKGVRLVIEALGRIPGENRPALVWCYNFASDSFLEEMQALASRLKVDFRPKMLVPDPELVDLLNRASAFVYAPRLEPFGFAPLEANACGAPVVAIAEGGVRETVVDDKNGIVVENDPGAMALAIQRLMSDPDLARRLGEVGEQIVREKWSPSAATDRLERHLFEVIEARRSTAGQS